MKRNTFLRWISASSMGLLFPGWFSVNASPGRLKPVLQIGESGVLPIHSRRELFVDGKIIESLRRLKLHLHTPVQQPLPRYPVQSAYMTVILDGYRYRAYFRAHDPGYEGPRFSGDPGEYTAYAESLDGKEWVHPELGLFEINGTRKNNAVLAGQPPFSHNFSPFLDTRRGVNPLERFKALAGHPRRGRPDRPDIPDGLYAFVSADGFHWKRKGDGPVIPYDASWSHAFDSQNVAFWSEAEGQYVCYFRTWETPHGRLRTISRTHSSDFVHWEKASSMAPNLPEEHLYTSQTFPYFRAPHIYIALPTRFFQQDTSTDILFMTSRAGSGHFDRLFTEAFIRPGLDPHQWSNRANYVALNVLPTGSAEMSIYHRSGHRYVLRTDGFVSVRAGSDRGELITRPMIFKGNKLELNYSTSAGGSIRIEFLGMDGAAISGFALKDSPLIKGDQISRIIDWEKSGGLKLLSGKPVKMRCVMQEADLYSFRFTGEGQ